MLALPAYSRRTTARLPAPKPPSANADPNMRNYFGSTAVGQPGNTDRQFFGQRSGSDFLYPDVARPQQLGQPAEPMRQYFANGGANLLPSSPESGPQAATQPMAYIPPNLGTMPGSGSPSMWTPSPMPVTPFANNSGGGSAAPSRNVFNNGAPNYTNYNPQNQAGYWHNPGGIGQDLNKALGGPMITQQAGAQHNVGSLSDAQTYALVQQANAARQGSMADLGSAYRRPQPTGGGGGGGGGNPLVDAFNEARAANEQRYNDILGGYNSARERANALLDQLGVTQRRDTQEIYDTNRGRIQNDMVNRGLTNSTVQDTTLTGNERQRGRALAAVEEGLARNRLATEYGLQKDQMDFMERRNDSYPDLALYANLIQQGAQADAGAGMGGFVDMGGAQFGYGGGGGLTYLPALANAGLAPSIAPLPPKSKGAGGKMQAPYKLRPGLGGKMPIVYSPTESQASPPVGSDAWLAALLAR